MQNAPRFAVPLAIALWQIACASPPPELARAESAYQAAARDPVIAKTAPSELSEAQKAVARAQRAWEDDGDADEARTLAYVAERKVEVARSAAERSALEEEFATLPAERTRLLLQARERELAESQRQAALAEERARAAESEAQLAHVAAAGAAGRDEGMETAIRELNARPTETGFVMTLRGDTLFAFDESDLLPGAQHDLDRLADFLRQDATRTALVEGHTDGVGAPSYNVELSRRRADAVKEYLVAQGVDGQRILAVGYGAGYPIAPNDNEAGRQENRRVEIVVLGPGDPLVPRHAQP